MTNKIKFDEMHFARRKMGNRFKNLESYIYSMKRGVFGIGLVMVVLLSLSFSVAQTNETNQSLALNCLQDFQKIILNLEQNNFSIQRVNDSYAQSKSYYDSQIILMGKNPTRASFEFVLQNCEQIKKIDKLAYESRDLYLSLKKFYQDSFAGEDAEIDTTSVDVIIAQIESELKNERYELVPDLVNRGYDEISTVKTQNTAVNIFYKQTKRTLKDFFIDNWIALVSTVVAIVILYYVYRKSIRKKIIKNKIKKLELQKSNLKKLLMKTQKDYFQDGKISDTAYKIRINNFGEMVRDIERQIPLLKEELIKIERGIKI